MPQSVRLPASLLPTGTYYTAKLAFGAAGTVADVILDTGSAGLAVDGTVFDPLAGGCATTNVMQYAKYGAGDSLCAIVTGAVALAGAPPVQIPDASIGVTYSGAAVFGSAGGIWGLAYQDLDAGLRMPADTWASKYDTSETGLGSPCDVTPLFDALTAEGLLGHQFAFRVSRAMPRQALADPAADPLNAGTFVVGGGMECDDLRRGPFSSIAVVHKSYFSVNLLSVQVGGQPAIPAPALPPGSTAASTAFVDSGMPQLVLNQKLFSAVVAAFEAIDPAYAATIRNASADGEDQAALGLGAWPNLIFSFQAAGGGVAAIAVAPNAYWQEDAAGPGKAVLTLAGSYRYGGQSVLGLPFFAGNYVVFDRSAPDGHGVVAVAPGAYPQP